MRLDPKLPGGTGLERNQAADGVSRYGTARGGTRGGYGDESNGTDNISLSGLSRTVRLLAAESPEREQRLSELAAAFEGGSYRVDAERIARSVIDETIRASL